MTYIDPAISAWALARIRENPRLSVEVDACLRRIPDSYRSLPPAERVLRADPVSDLIGLTALINSVGSAAVGFGSTFTIAGIGASAIGGALVGTPVSLSISFTGCPHHVAH
jgi:hypothetical protein